MGEASVQIGLDNAVVSSALKPFQARRTYSHLLAVVVVFCDPVVVAEEIEDFRGWLVHDGLSLDDGRLAHALAPLYVEVRPPHRHSVLVVHLLPDLVAGKARS